MYNYKINISENLSGIRVKLFLTCFFLLCLFSAQAQFTITDDFRNQGSSDIVIGDGAYFTSGIDDPMGAGWLRLTKSETNQKGYAYINRTFPSTLGLLIDFEYKMWRNTGATNAGADGMTFFLFDGAVTQANFRLGGYGGSLGYARNTSATPAVNNGLRGGYIGVGLDAYGNFSNPNEGRNLGPGMRPNAIVIRGATNETTAANSNPFLATKELGVRTGSDADVRGRDEIDYNSIVTARPGDATFYRRVQLEIIPTIDGKYRIVVRWKKALTGAFAQEIEYLTTDVPPSLLKLGFAASTGSDLNFHELRNLQITTPRNLRVSKRANKDILRSVPAGTNADQITYVIEVVNDTDQAYTSATFLDELRDIDGNMIPSDMFDITNITSSGFTNISIAESTTTANRIEGTLSIAPGITGLIQVTGKLSKIPSYNVLRNTVTVLPTNGVDFDLGNNTATVSTPVIAENVDLILQKESVGQICLDATNGNTMELRVANMGAEEAIYRRPGSNGNRIVVIKEVPNGYTYDDSQTITTTSATGTNTTARWYKFTETITNGYTGHGGVQFPTGGMRYYYVARFPTSAANQVLEGMGSVYENNYPIRYTIKPTANTTSFTDVARVEYRSNTTSNLALGNPNGNIESGFSPPNTANNNSIELISTLPPQPTVANATIYYCLGQAAAQLNASTTVPNAKLVWYLNEGGTAETTAPIPLTNAVGTTRFYVAQKVGNCQSNFTTIDVIVLPIPSAGVIADPQTTCSGGSTTAITSTTAGQATGWPPGTAVTYRWESSANGSTGWNTISGATSATYAPGALTVTTHYRRITVATISGKSCESAVTNTVVKTVNTVNAGSISGDQTICTGGSFTQIGSTTPGSGSATTVTYRWESSATGAAGSWTTISGATALTYTPVNTVTTYFRRVTISTLNGVACEAASNTIIKAVNTVNAGSISGDQTICTGGSFTQISSTIAGSGSATTVTYRWESSSTGAAGSWTTISGANAVTYTPVNTVTTYFRRVTISTLNSVACEAASNSIVKTVNAVNAGVIVGDQNICTGITPTQITSTSNGSAPTGANITYRWEISNTGTGGWSTISGATGTTYTPVNTTTMYFRRVTVSTLNTVPCEVVSNVIAVAFKNCKMITNPMIRQRTK